MQVIEERLDLPNNKIKDDYLAGFSTTFLAEKHGCSINAIRNRLFNQNVHLRTQGQSRRGKSLPEKLRQRLKLFCSSTEERERRRQFQLEHNTAKSDSAKQKISESKQGEKNPNYGKPCPEHVKEAVSQANRGRLPKSHGRGKRCYYTDKEGRLLCFRSTYELAFAKYLDQKGINWEYETDTYDLGSETYTPDFKIYEGKCFRYIEIKGWLYERGKRKIDQFRIFYPELPLEVLFRDDLIAKGVQIK